LGVKVGPSVACDLILYLLLLKEKEDDCETDCPYRAVDDF
jgi:hypothetical protein